MVKEFRTLRVRQAFERFDSLIGPHQCLATDFHLPANVLPLCDQRLLRRGELTKPIPPRRQPVDGESVARTLDGSHFFQLQQPLLLHAILLGEQRGVARQPGGQHLPALIAQAFTITEQGGESELVAGHGEWWLWVVGCGLGKALGVRRGKSQPLHFLSSNA